MKGFTLLIILKFKKQEAARPVSKEEKKKESRCEKRTLLYHNHDHQGRTTSKGHTYHMTKYHREDECKSPWVLRCFGGVSLC